MVGWSLLFYALLLNDDVENLVVNRITTIIPSTIACWILYVWPSGLVSENVEMIKTAFCIIFNCYRKVWELYFWNLRFPFSCVIQVVFSFCIILLLTALTWEDVCDIPFTFTIWDIFNFYLIHEFHKTFCCIRWFQLNRNCDYLMILDPRHCLNKDF